MNITLEFSINPALAETLISSIIVILMLIVLAWVVRKFV